MGHLVLLGRSRRLAMTMPPHLTVEEMASMLDGGLSAEERAAAERHLAGCDACREELAACSRAVASGSSAPARRFPWRMAAPLAAGIALAVMLGHARDPDRAPEASERSAPAGDARIAIIAPPPSASLRPGTIRFVWRPVEGSIGYRLVVKDASGAPVWSADVADTALALPDSVPLRAGALYVWRVDGERADGSTTSSPETGFRVAR